ncbi:DUF3043 domain-containing protein [Nakamurella silvestris]|nr:DUF3043 domain-containing protein [Nakamurella silvestris]
MPPQDPESIRLVSVSFLNRKSPAAEAALPATPAETEADNKVVLGKGAPTPKRSEKVQRRGPVAPPPMTQREALKRAKTAAGGRPLTKDEKRVQAAQRRERMMKGDDGYLLARDKGPVRAFVRDLTDSRRNLAGVLLPVAILSFIVLLVPDRTVQAYAPLILMIVLLGALADTIIFSRQISKRVAAKFPKGDPTGLSLRGRSLGFYAFNRAMLPRKWRAPRPRFKSGDVVE